MSGRLVIVCQHSADARRAEDGGADGVIVVGSREDGGISPEPDIVDDVRQAVDLDVRPLVKLRAGYSTDGGEATRLCGLIADYRRLGADGMALGFLNGRSEIDQEVLSVLLGEADWPWTFTRAFDSCLDSTRAWQVARAIPRLDSVVTAGSARDVEHGLDDLISRARADARTACLIQAGGNLQPEHVPWLTRAGVRRFQIGDAARPRRSWKAYVDTELVQSWRTLIDKECDRVQPAGMA